MTQETPQMEDGSEMNHSESEYWMERGYFEPLVEYVPVILLFSWVSVIIAFFMKSYVAFAIMFVLTAQYLMMVYYYSETENEEALG